MIPTSVPAIRAARRMRGPGITRSITLGRLPPIAARSGGPSPPRPMRRARSKRSLPFPLSGMDTGGLAPSMTQTAVSSIRTRRGGGNLCRYSASFGRGPWVTAGGLFQSQQFASSRSGQICKFELNFLGRAASSIATGTRLFASSFSARVARVLFDTTATAATGANPTLQPLSPFPLARPLLRFGDLVGRHLLRHQVAIVDGGAATGGVGRREVRGGKIEPHMRADIVQLPGLALGVGEPEIVLGLGVVLVRSEAKPRHRLAVVLRHAPAAVVEKPEHGLGAGIALGRERTRQPQRGLVVAFLIGGVGGIGVRGLSPEADCLRETDGGLLDRLTIDAEREAERQHEDGDGRGDRASEFRPTSGHVRALAQRRLQARHALLQDFGF